MGNGSEILLACDMTFVSREKTLISQWEVGVGMVAGGGPMARLPLATASVRSTNGRSRTLNASVNIWKDSTAENYQGRRRRGSE